MDNKKFGRPTEIKDAVNIKIVLPAEYIELARKLGDSNVSKGLRTIIADYSRYVGQVANDK